MDPMKTSKRRLKMKHHRNLQFGAAILAVLVLLALFPSVAALCAQDAPEIQITEVPPARNGTPDEMYPIAGKVTGAPKDAKTVIYAFAGSKWWVQPWDYAPLTEIKSGKFETETHPGTIYAVLLVKSSYKPAATLQRLPEVEGDVLARHRVAGKRE
jgi:hypothetical protein